MGSAELALGDRELNPPFSCGGILWGGPKELRLLGPGVLAKGRFGRFVRDCSQEVWNSGTAPVPALLIPCHSCLSLSLLIARHHKIPRL